MPLLRNHGGDWWEQNREEFERIRSHMIHESPDSIRMATMREAILQTGTLTVPRPLGRAAAQTIQPRKKKQQSDDEEFISETREKLYNGEPVPDCDCKRYMSLVKRGRHIEKSERTVLHKPVCSGPKTGSVDIDDLVK